MLDLEKAFGKSPPPKPAPASPAADEPIRTDYDRETYAWASDVFFVYENLNATAKQAKAFSPARQALLKHAKGDMANFMGQLLPKAMQLLEKAKDKGGDMDGVIIEEKKGIAELTKILKAAIVESQEETN